MIQQQVEQFTGSLTDVLEDFKKRLSVPYFERFTLKGIKVSPDTTSPFLRLNLKDFDIVARSINNTHKMVIPGDETESLLITEMSTANPTENEFAVSLFGDCLIVPNPCYEGERPYELPDYGEIDSDGSGDYMAWDDTDYIALDSDIGLIWNEGITIVINAYASDLANVKNDIVDGFLSLYFYLYQGDSNLAYHALQNLSDVSKNCFAENTAPVVIRKVITERIVPYRL